MIRALLRLVLAAVVVVLTIMLAIPFCLLALPLFIMAAPVVLLVVLAKLLGKGRRREMDSVAEEVRLMQEFHHSLDGLERRMEALETILFDRLGPTAG
ncbi:hypothetical protein FJY63_04445 [Candidatus Sumerlaeota bacterium]|nr:hypothetical protein [Candidatus Sumerlaeota bacterium]